MQEVLAIGGLLLVAAVVWRLAHLLISEFERRLARELTFVEVLIGVLAFPYSALLLFVIPDRSAQAHRSDDRTER